MEIFEEVKIYEINMKCNKCNDGYMEFLNRTITPSTIYSGLEYLHRCNNCGYEEYYKHIYPRRISKCIPTEDDVEIER